MDNIHPLLQPALAAVRPPNDEGPPEGFGSGPLNKAPKEMMEHESRMKAALRLIWYLHIRENQHLGMERYSGLEHRCIACICALALGEGIGFAAAAEFEAELAKIEAERHG